MFHVGDYDVIIKHVGSITDISIQQGDCYWRNTFDRIIQGEPTLEVIHSSCVITIDDSVLVIPPRYLFYTKQVSDYLTLELTANPTGFKVGLIELSKQIAHSSYGRYTSESYIRGHDSQSEKLDAFETVDFILHSDVTLLEDSDEYCILKSVYKDFELYIVLNGVKVGNTNPWHEVSTCYDSKLIFKLSQTNLLGISYGSSAKYVVETPIITDTYQELRCRDFTVVCGVLGEGCVSGVSCDTPNTIHVNDGDTSIKIYVMC